MNSVIKIIIADDKPIWRENISVFLKDYPFIHVIGEASNGIELIETLKEKAPDVILLDLSMPKMDGNKTMAYLTMNYPEMKIIIFSDFDEQEIVEHYIARGARGFVSKGRSIFDLIPAIKKVQKGGRYYSRTKPRESIELTNRNKEYIHLVAEGKKREEIATALGITPWGVDRQKKKVMNALGVDESGLLNSIFRLGFNFFGKIWPKRD